MSLLKSTLLHFFLLSFFLMILKVNHHDDSVTPIELMELIPKEGTSPNQVPHRPAPHQNTKPKTTSAPSLSLSTESTTLASSSSNSQNTDNSLPPGVYEDYEAAELPVLLNLVKIRYPVEAKAKGIQGSVVFKLVVNAEGVVTQAVVLSSPSELLSKPALDAVRQFKFKPARLNDKAIAIQFRYTYRFELE